MSMVPQKYDENLEDVTSNDNTLLDFNAGTEDSLRQLLADFAARKRLIPCAYEMDEGSFLYLEERVRRALEEKPI